MSMFHRLDGRQRPYAGQGKRRAVNQPAGVKSNGHVNLRPNGLFVSGQSSTQRVALPRVVLVRNRPNVPTNACNLSRSQ